MGVSDFRHLYLAALGLITVGVIILLTAEVVAAWFNRQTGDTISEIVWSAHVPGFLLIIATGIWVSVGIGLGIHFIARGRAGL
jgi:uncharacterized membrane protein